MGNEEEAMAMIRGGSRAAETTSFRTGHSAENELLGDTYGLGATVQVFIEKLQTNRMVDPRWVEKAKTHFQEGLSATRRAIMKNDRF